MFLEVSGYTDLLGMRPTERLVAAAIVKVSGKKFECFEERITKIRQFAMCSIGEVYRTIRNYPKEFQIVNKKGSSLEPSYIRVKNLRAWDFRGCSLKGWFYKLYEEDVDYQQMSGKEKAWFQKYKTTIRNSYAYVPSCYYQLNKYSRRHKIDPIDIMVLDRLYFSYFRKVDGFFPSHECLANWLNVEREKIRNSINKLCSMGLLHIKRKAFPGSSNVYWVPDVSERRAIIENILREEGLRRVRDKRTKEYKWVRNNNLPLKKTQITPEEQEKREETMKHSKEYLTAKKEYEEAYFQMMDYYYNTDGLVYSYFKYEHLKKLFEVKEVIFRDVCRNTKEEFRKLETKKADYDKMAKARNEERIKDDDYWSQMFDFLEQRGRPLPEIEKTPLQKAWDKFRAEEGSLTLIQRERRIQELKLWREREQAENN